jgi:hypothetical protein
MVFCRLHHFGEYESGWKFFEGKCFISPYFRHRYRANKTVSRDVLLQVFFINHLPPSPIKNIRVTSKVFENSRSYSQVKVHYRYQRHRWQIMGTISDYLHLKVKLNEKNYLYVNSTTVPKGVQTK